MSDTRLTDPPTLAARYTQDMRALLGTRLRICCWLGVTLVPLFGGLDWIVYRERFFEFTMIRGVISMLNALGLLALGTRIGGRVPVPLSVFVFLQTGLGIVAMTALGGGGASPYYAGINLVMLAAAVLVPWELAVSIATCGVLVVSYVLSCALVAGIGDPRTFVANLFFLCSTALITVMSHGAAAAARRRELRQRIALEEAGRHRDHFLANVTHELRTPLAAILGFCEMLADYTTDATSMQLGWLARIRENALTLYRLIVQLLDFSKIEAGSMVLACEQVRVDAIVAKVAEDMRAIAGADGTTVTVEMDADAPTLVGDAARVEEILTNLASNALKFSAGRPVTVQVTTGPLELEWNRVVPDPGLDAIGRTYVRVAVIDRGCGISHDDLRRLFVSFQQLDGSSTRRHGGTGLGLAISARLAAAMRAHIAVRTELGSGSTFAFVAPVADPVNPAVSGVSATSGDDGLIADPPRWASTGSAGT